MSKIRGKRLTVNQAKLLSANGVNDTNDWLYVKQETIDQDGNKSSAINRPKTIVMVFQNRISGEVRKVPT